MDKSMLDGAVVGVSLNRVRIKNYSESYPVVPDVDVRSCPAASNSGFGFLSRFVPHLPPVSSVFWK